MSIKPHILENRELKSLFTKFFGPSVKNAYSCVTMETGEDLSILFEYDRDISEKYKNINGCMSIDAKCDLVVEIDAGLEHIYLEITLASDGEPMIFAKFDSNDAVIVSR